jgi:hypothetical protein
MKKLKKLSNSVQILRCQFHTPSPLRPDTVRIGWHVQKSPLFIGFLRPDKVYRTAGRGGELVAPAVASVNNHNNREKNFTEVNKLYNRRYYYMLEEITMALSNHDDWKTFLTEVNNYYNRDTILYWRKKP